MDPSKAWVAVDQSPCCKVAGEVVSVLQGAYYAAFGVSTPRPRIELARCSCGLIYKRVVPSLAFMAHAISASKQDAWSIPYGYEDEVRVITSLQEGTIDLIDVGAAGGGLLNAIPGEGRRSALDVVRFDALRVRGEFIEGFLDVGELRWSGEPYDLVTAFDIFEHLYDPNQAMVNIRALLRPRGHLLLETGDSDAERPGRLGLWSYLNLFEHHIAWNEESIRHLARRHGFSVVRFERKAHKLAQSRSYSLGEHAEYAVYSVSPTLYRHWKKLRGAAGVVPVAPGARDHFRAVLQRDD